MRPIIHLVFAALIPSSIAVAQEKESYGKISLTALEDKIQGGWAGQMIGVSFGFPTEFEYREQIMPAHELPEWRPEMVEESLKQDDLYVDITFAQVMDDKGLDASSEDFGELLRNARYPLWHANLAARRALRRGVPASLSGTPKYNLHAHDIDFQIESDFIGLMSPGMPRSSNEISFRAGRVMNHGEGIYGGMFISAMYAAAFFNNDIEVIIRNGISALPRKSEYARLIDDVLDWWKESPNNWQSTWGKIQDNWNTGEMCPEGAVKTFNIDAKINGAYVVLGLLYGGGDFEKTMNISTRSGQDSDCNPSSALGILGVVRGYGNIPEKFTQGFQKIANTKFIHTRYSFNEIVDSTLNRAIALSKTNGGYIDGTHLYVTLQKPTPAKFVSWQGLGAINETFSYEHPRWQWKGDWQDETMRIWRYEHKSKTSSSPEAEAIISFDGTGAVLKGILLPDGGLLDIYLNGEFNRTVDVYPDELNSKPEESIWHEFGLPNKRHELHLKVRGKAYKESLGAKISISELIVYQK